MLSAVERATEPSRQALDTRGMQHLLGYSLTLAEVAGRRVFQQHIGLPLGLRPVEFTLLVLLRDNPGITSSQLAVTLQLPPPNITVLVDRLVKRALVRRQRSNSDGRAVQLSLSAKGLALVQRAAAASQTMEQGWLSTLSAAEQAMLAELLKKLLRQTD